MNGVPTALDAFRGTPYIQMDLRVTRPFKFGERWEIRPFAEFFNLFNRNNPGANFVANIAALPLPPSDIASGNATNICLDFPTCAPAPARSPASSNWNFPPAAWATSSVQARRWEFPSPHSWACG